MLAILLDSRIESDDSPLAVRCRTVSCATVILDSIRSHALTGITAGRSAWRFGEIRWEV